jgi:hypothetical protein
MGIFFFARKFLGKFLAKKNWEIFDEFLEKQGFFFVKHYYLSHYFLIFFSCFIRVCLGENGKGQWKQKKISIQEKSQISLEGKKSGPIFVLLYNKN